MSTVEQLCERIRTDSLLRPHTVHVEHIPATPAEWTDWPEWLHPALDTALRAQGHDRLYSHQGQACALAQAGQDVLVTTPTASGKSFCYLLPVLDRLLRDPEACALYLAPTKALGQDQKRELDLLYDWLSFPGGLTADAIAIYDGDTPPADRPRIRDRARFLISNPDMLHIGILPYHDRNWARFCSRLAFVVVDEVHVYRGVFGSHVSHVLRRLQRVCASHGTTIQFLCASATVANEEELTTRLLGRRVSRIHRNGAPCGPRQVFFLNPPVRDPVTGFRDTAQMVRRVVRLCLDTAVRHIIFGRTRNEVERLLLDLRRDLGRQVYAQGILLTQEVTHRIQDYRSLETLPVIPIRMSKQEVDRRIRGYRSGYRPEERRAIEAGLRDGSVLSVVTTNALELGIDIGHLQCAIMMRYAGSVASTWQQMGRAGRRQDLSLAVFVASHNPLDQYLIAHPEFLFDNSPEHALINPAIPPLLLSHLACALYEWPVSDHHFPDDPYLALPQLERALDFLAHQREAYRQRDRWQYRGATTYPAGRVNLRNMGRTFQIVQASSRLRDDVPLGTVEEESAPNLTHPGAIYMHEGRTFRVETLDFTRAEVRVRADQTLHNRQTLPIEQTHTEVLQAHQQVVRGGALIGYGTVQVQVQVVGYREKSRHQTLADAHTDNVTAVDCPVQTLRTEAYWIQVLSMAQRWLEERNLWRDSHNDYGPNWQSQRRRVLARFQHRCARCGRPGTKDNPLDVHHLRPFRTYGYVPHQNTHYLQANALDNLQLLCRRCHTLAEPVQWQGLRGLSGLGQALHNIAPLHLMCDPADLRLRDSLAHSAPTRVPESTVPEFQPHRATLFLHERIPEGLGFGRILYTKHETLLTHVESLIGDCVCEAGCPACVGPTVMNEEVRQEGVTRKQLAGALVQALQAP